MVTDRIELAGALKIFAFFAYLIYFSTNGTNLGKFYENNAEIKPDTELKRELLSNKCLLLLGGSNVRMGLSAEVISFKSCMALNLGVSSEAGGFQKYLNWLNNNALADKVIYSSAEMWRDSPLNGNDKRLTIKFPKNSMFSLLKSILFSSKNSAAPQFSKFGDQMEYKCPNEFPSFKIDINNFIKFDNLIAQEIYNRIFYLKQGTNASEIFLRIPPVYIKNIKQAELYVNLMNKRIEMLKELGVKMVGLTIVSTDSSLFCDSLHPNANGREVFSKEIRGGLQKSAD